jgi:hypothetical protein
MSDSSTVWELVNPEGPARPASLTPAARPGRLEAAQRIGLAWNGKPGGEEALEEIARLLDERVDGLQFIKYWQVLPESVSERELSLATIEAIAARRPDVVIVSQAD